MSRLMRVFGALVFVGTALVASTAGAPTAVAGPVDPAYCPGTTVSGNVTYTPGVTATPSPNTFVLTVSCTATGVGHNAGSYSLTLNGTTPLDTCAGGANLTGSGSITGSGPHGSTSGTFTFTRPGIHYYIDGSYTAGGSSHTIKLWLDIINHSPSPCFYNQADIIGHGTFSDNVQVGGGGGPAAAQMTGTGTISPGLTLAAAPFSISFLSTSVVGDFNGVPGTCFFSFSGAGTGTILMASGSGSATCNGSDILSGPISISCSLSFTMPGWMMTGTCTGTSSGAFNGTFSVQNTSPGGIPMTTFVAEGPFTIV